MRSVSADDATMRARIRDAAVRRFGQHGYAAASLRAIATDAGSSPALVLHHFGSKSALRSACDDWVVDQIFDRKDEADPSRADVDEMTAVMAEWLADVETFRPQLDYLSRMLFDGGPEGERLFDRLVEHAQVVVRHGIASGAMHPVSDLPMTALLLTVHGLASLVLQRQITRTLGASELDGDLVQRMTVPSLELYCRGLYRDDRLLVAATSAVGTPAEKRP